MKNKKIRNVLLVLGSLIIIYLLLQIPSCEPKPKKQYWENPNFKPDTIKVDKPYPVKGDAYPVQIPPYTIIEYVDNPNPNNIKCEKDSLIKVIDSLGKAIAQINKTYLTQFPSASKFIGGLFKRDTIKFDLLKISGSIETQVYPTDFENYEYKWVDNKMGVKKIEQNKSTNKPERKLNHAFYVNGGYSILNRVPILSADYYIRYRKIQFNVEPKITIEEKPTLELNGKIGIRLK